MALQFASESFPQLSQLFSEVTPTIALVCPNDLVQVWLLSAGEVAGLILLLLVCRHMDPSAALQHEWATEAASVLHPATGIATLEGKVVVVAVAHACGPGGVSHPTPALGAPSCR